MIAGLFLAAALAFLLFAIAVLAKPGSGSRGSLYAVFAAIACLPWLTSALSHLSGLPRIVQLGVLAESLFRFRNPWFTPLSAFVSLYLLWRSPPERFSPSRARLIVLSTWALGTTLALVPALPELGHPVDRLAVVTIPARWSSLLDTKPACAQRCKQRNCPCTKTMRLRLSTLPRRHACKRRYAESKMLPERKV
jgi:hypothetical protein